MFLPFLKRFLYLIEAINYCQPRERNPWVIHSPSPLLRYRKGRFLDLGSGEVLRSGNSKTSSLDIFMSHSPVLSFSKSVKKKERWPVVES